MDDIMEYTENRADEYETASMTVFFEQGWQAKLGTGLHGTFH